MHKSEAVESAATALYEELLDAGIDVMFDDRVARPGVMFAEMELMGIPHRLVVSDKGLKENQFEYKGRLDSEARMIPRESVLEFIRGQLESSE